ncbi:MAG: hypothetical protein ACHQD9_07155 [Chitinophagales bacterium]
MKRIFLVATVSLLLLIEASTFSFAQCSLCKSSAESSLQEGDPQAKGLNLGIMYLLVMPYLLVGGIGYWWYVQKKKESKQEDV